MNSQVTNTILMIRPVAFKRNPETVDNHYQKDIVGVDNKEIQKRALQEFDNFVNKLRGHGIEVIVVEDMPNPPSPDSIFPNNWISTHEDGSVLLYPMYAENRRKERRSEVTDALAEVFVIDKIDRSLLNWERNDLYLEGTGSMILDRVNKIAYAAISERTDKEVLRDFGNKKGYSIVSFQANQTVDGERMAIYHTNVMMCLGEAFALICLDTIDDPAEKEAVIASLEKSGKEVVAITEDQNNHFAGNMLQLMNERGERLVVMSEAAYKSLDPPRISQLEKHGRIVYSNIDTIETLGGGSARCMMAEIFLPGRN